MTRAKRRKKRAFKSVYQTTMTEEQASALDLPMYRAEDWLRRQKEELKTFAAISRKFGYPETTLSEAARRFGWPPVKPPRGFEQHVVLYEWTLGDRNMSALARKHGVSVSSVHRWVQYLSDPDVRDLIMDDLENLTRP